MTQIEKLRLRLGIKDETQDDLLNMLLEDAQNEILDFTHRNTLLNKMEGLQRELAIIYYNRMNDEGISSRSEGAISVSYSTEIPGNIKDRLKAYKLLKAVGMANESKK